MGSIAFEVYAGGKLVVDPIEHSAIHSRENPRFKLYRSLMGGRAVKKHSLSILAGPRLVREIWQAGLADCEAVLCKAGEVPQLPELPGQPAVPVFHFTADLFQELDFLGGGSPLLVVRVPELPEYRPEQAEMQRGLTVCLPLTDPDNLGGAIRSCAAFGVDRIVVMREAAHPYHARALRAAAAQTWRVPLYVGPSLADWQSLPQPLFALDMQGDSLAEIQPPEDLTLLVGAEGPGLPDNYDGRRARIPMRAGTESLNAGVALGIALYHFRRI